MRSIRNMLHFKGLDLKGKNPLAPLLLIALSIIWASFDIVYFSIALAMFLKTFGAKYFPHSIVLSSALQFFAGYALKHADRYFSRKQVLSLTCLFNVFISAFLYLIVIVYDQSWGIFFMYCLVSMFASLFSSVRYDLAAYYFDIQQTKKLGPYLTRGYELGILVAGLSIQPMLDVFSVGSLFILPLLLAIAFYFVFSLAIKLLKIQFPNNPRHQPRRFMAHKDKNQKVNTGYIFKDLYTRYIFLSLISLSIIFNLWTYLFYLSLEDIFSKTASISSFLALFNSSLSLCIVLTMAISAKLINRFGVSVGFRSIAIIAFFGSIAGFVSDSLMQICRLVKVELVPNFVWQVCTYSVIILGMFLINYALYNIYDPIKILLTQPYPDRVKTQINRLILLIMGPASTLIAAGSVFLAVNVFELSILALFGITFLASIVLKLLAGHVTQGYAHKISDRLVKKSLHIHDLGAVDKETQALLVKGLDSSDTSEVIYSINVLTALDSTHSEQYVSKLFSINNRASLECALRVIENLKLHTYLTHVKAILCDQEKAPELRAYALRVYAKLSTSDQEFLHSFLQNESVPIQKEALVALIANQDDKAISILQRRFSSPQKDDLMLALDVASQGAPEDFVQQIEALFLSEDIQIKEHAIKTACSLKITSAVSPAIDLMLWPSLRKNMPKSLQCFGEDLIPLVREVISDKHLLFAQFKIIIRALAKMNHPKANEFLFKKSFELSSRRKDYILRCLLKNDYIMDPSENLPLEEAISHTLQLIHHFISNNVTLVRHQGTEDIQKGLRETTDFLIRRLLTYTAFKYKTIDNSFLLRNFYAADASLNALALEYLEYQLNRQEHKKLMPVFIHRNNLINMKQHLDRIYGEKRYTLQECLQNILDARMHVSLWGLASALMYIGSHEIKHFSDQLSRFFNDRVPLLVEAAYYNLYRLDREAFMKRKDEMTSHPFAHVRQLLKKLPRS